MEQAKVGLRNCLKVRQKDVGGYVLVVRGDFRCFVFCGPVYSDPGAG